MNSVLKKTLLSSLVVPFALGVQTATAAKVTDWGYDVQSTFTDFDATSGNGSVTASNGNRTLSWGTQGPGYPDQSSISITDVNATDGLKTDGGYVNGGTFTHDNQVISASDAALSSFDLTSALELTPFNPSGGGPMGQTSTTFESFFKETPNNGNCVTAATSNCDDIFTVGNLGENATETDKGYEFASDPFSYDGYDYTVYLELAGLATLDGDACSAAGSSTGCVGLLTEEGDDNQFDTRFRIASTAAVPEPGTLALLGMGLAGLGLSRRKKASKS